MKLNELAPSPGSRRPRKRVGRGIGSGTGKTSGKGNKGQKSRSGVATRTFEGGQMPIYRRLPKRGFHNPFRKVYNPINLDRLQAAVDAGRIDPKKPVDWAALAAAGLVKKRLDGVRLLARGELTVALTIQVEGASKAAAAAVQKAGGKLVLPKSDADAAETEAPARGKRARSKKPSGGEQAEAPGPAAE
jgi:large subunit ribosomal protein L15